MSSEIAIKVENLSKCYLIYDRPQDRLWQMLARGWKQFYREFWALRGVSFEIRRGETVGIIGRNGSGKSTLLQLICGTLNPTGGSVQTHGRIAALLELGAGFNPEFTGRENVYLYASMMGLGKAETDARFDSIVAFADIGDFIEQPVKTYSSGMFVRLAFSVVAHVDADILIVDEALAVGDVFFQQKCMRFLRDFRDQGGTTLFVSHDTGAVLNLCDNAVLLHPGGEKPPVLGDAETVCKLYLKQIYSAPERLAIAESAAEPTPASASGTVAEAGRGSRRHYEPADLAQSDYVVGNFRPDAESFGIGGARIVDAGFMDADGERLQRLRGDQNVAFFIKAKFDRSVVSPAFGLMLKNARGEYLFTEGTDRHFRQHQLVFGAGDTVVVKFGFLMPNLIQGKYPVNVALAEGTSHEHVQLHWLHDAIILDCVASRAVHGHCAMNEISMSIEHEVMESIG